MTRLLAVLVVAVASAQADSLLETFGSGENQFQIQFVTIGNPGNSADTTGYPNPAGSVGYAYNLGKYEVSRDQIEKANAEGELGITLLDMTSFGGNDGNRPATGISWFEAARFINYLNTSQGKQAAYRFDETGNFQLWNSGQYSGINQYRHKDAYYFLPSVDEWYKGAFGSPEGAWYNFPNGSDSAPSAVAGGTSGAVYNQSGFQGPADITNAGGLSPYGTMAQGGNVWEWNETASDLSNDSLMEDRILRGGSWLEGDAPFVNERLSSLSPTTNQSLNTGLRVAMVPEPSSLSLLLAGGAVLMVGRRIYRSGKITEK